MIRTAENCPKLGKQNAISNFNKLLNITYENKMDATETCCKMPENKHINTRVSLHHIL